MNLTTTKTLGKVGLVVVVGNEDGAHHVAAEIYQALHDLGFSLPPTAVTYWVGEAMTGKEYSEFEKLPKKVADSTAMAAAGAAHLARLLKANPHPGGRTLVGALTITLCGPNLSVGPATKLPELKGWQSCHCSGVGAGDVAVLSADVLCPSLIRGLFLPLLIFHDALLCARLTF